MGTSSAPAVSRGRKGLTARHREWIRGYAILVPAFACVLGLILYPAAWGIYFAFTDKVVGKPERFVGLRNFFWVLEWPDFGLMIVNTIAFTVAAVALKVVVGMTMALVFNEDMPARSAARALMFLPWTV